MKMDRRDFLSMGLGVLGIKEEQRVREWTFEEFVRQNKGKKFCIDTRYLNWKGAKCGNHRKSVGVEELIGACRLERCRLQNEGARNVEMRVTEFKGEEWMDFDSYYFEMKTF